MIPTQLTEEPISYHIADRKYNQTQCFIAYRQEVIMKQEVIRKQEVMITER